MPKRGATGRAGAAAIAIALFSLSGLAGCGGGSEDNPGPPDMSKIAYARTYLSGQWTLPKQTPKSVAAALARLKPTYVTGLLRYENGQGVGPEQAHVYNTVRQLVREQAPRAQFDVELNALEYRTPHDIEQDMDAIRPKLDNDGWYFDFFTPAWQKRPDVVRAMISEAHSHGEWIGGNAFGWTKHPDVPPGADFLGVTDSNFTVDLSATRQLAGEVPILLHTRNNPGNPHSEGCDFVARFSDSDRESYVRHRAAQQAKGDFRFAFPVFFPTCNLPRITAFDALQHRPVLRVINKQMSKHS